jgi:hypothetical protein
MNTTAQQEGETGPTGSETDKLAVVKGAASRRRNRQRITEANLKDEEIISKYPADERLTSSSTDVVRPARQGLGN